MLALLETGQAAGVCPVWEINSFLELRSLGLLQWPMLNPLDFLEFNVIFAYQQKHKECLRIFGVKIEMKAGPTNRMLYIFWLAAYAFFRDQQHVVSISRILQWRDSNSVYSRPPMRTVNSGLPQAFTFELSMVAMALKLMYKKHHNRLIVLDSATLYSFIFACASTSTIASLCNIRQTNLCVRCTVGLKR